MNGMKAKLRLALTALLAATACAQAQITETHSFMELNCSIPDGNLAGIHDVRTLSSAVQRVSSVKVRLRVVGEYNGDLYAYLRHIQSGVTNYCVLLNRPGRTLWNFYGYDDSGLDVTFSDSAPNGDIHVYRSVLTPLPDHPLTGEWQPDGRWIDPLFVLDTDDRLTSLAAFAGADGNGQWTLYLADCDTGGTNLLAGWQLELFGAAQPQISWTPPAPITYGTPLDETQLNASVTFAGTNVSGTFTYSPPAGTVLNAGAAQTLSVSFAPSDTNSFLPVSTIRPLTVGRAPLSVAANNASRAWGAANPVFSGTLSGVRNGDPITASYATGASSGSPVGGYDIVPSLSDPADRLANYEIAATNGTLTVFNSAPVLGAVAGQWIGEGNTLTLAMSATDPDLPAQSLTYSLAPGAPAGASLDAGTGIFTWTPPVTGFSRTNSITVRVTDNALPSQEASTQFDVVVVAPPQLVSTEESGGKVIFTWSVINGLTYQPQFKEGIADPTWTNLEGLRRAGQSTLSATNDSGTNIHRYYRLLLNHE